MGQGGMGHGRDGYCYNFYDTTKVFNYLARNQFKCRHQTIGTSDCSCLGNTQIELWHCGDVTGALWRWRLTAEGTRDHVATFHIDPEVLWCPPIRKKTLYHHHFYCSLHLCSTLLPIKFQANWMTAYKPSYVEEIFVVNSSFSNNKDVMNCHMTVQVYIPGW